MRTLGTWEGSRLDPTRDGHMSSLYNIICICICTYVYNIIIIIMVLVVVKGLLPNGNGQDCLAHGQSGWDVYRSVCCV